jgi:hypothetical protein
MINYNNRTIEPLLGAITEAMQRTFLTKTARSQGQRIKYFRDPFKLVPISEIAEIADKFTRNEILSANEIRAFIGVKPSKDAKANELRNSNMPQQDTMAPAEVPVEEGVEADTESEGILQAGMDTMMATLDEILSDLGAEADVDA